MRRRVAYVAAVIWAAVAVAMMPSVAGAMANQVPVSLARVLVMLGAIMLAGACWGAAEERDGE